LVIEISLYYDAPSKKHHTSTKEFYPRILPIITSLQICRNKIKILLLFHITLFIFDCYSVSVLIHVAFVYIIG